MLYKKTITNNLRTKGPSLKYIFIRTYNELVPYSLEYESLLVEFN